MSTHMRQKPNLKARLGVPDTAYAARVPFALL
jgi:hypothetical protein